MLTPTSTRGLVPSHASSYGTGDGWTRLDGGEGGYIATSTKSLAARHRSGGATKKKRWLTVTVKLPKIRFKATLKSKIRT